MVSESMGRDTILCTISGSVSLFVIDRAEQVSHKDARPTSTSRTRSRQSQGLSDDQVEVSDYVEGALNLHLR